jgi:single-strand DNA-binding protein
MARSLNKVELIGNLTRDPELRYTPQGTAVCTFGLATNRQWTTGEGEKKEDAEFHRIVAWNKLAELCAQLLTKGRKAYVEGRLQTRRWTGQDGQERTTTEIVISDMIILDTRGAPAAVGTDEFNIPPEEMEQVAPPEEGSQAEGTPASKAPARNSGSTKTSDSQTKKKPKVSKKKDDSAKVDDEPEDIPF